LAEACEFAEEGVYTRVVSILSKPELLLDYKSGLAMAAELNSFTNGCGVDLICLYLNGDLSGEFIDAYNDRLVAKVRASITAASI
jgi:hypothetical protein